MKTDISFLPQQNRDDLNTIVSFIKEMVPDLKVVILYGSYARGGFKEAKDLAPDRKSGDISDYDIFVVVKLNETAQNSSLWNGITNRCRRNDIIPPVRIIPYTKQKLESRLREQHYFYSDIIREGIELYNPHELEFIIPNEVPKEKQKAVAQEHLEKWFPQAKGFLKGYNFHLSEYNNNNSNVDLNLAAFNLHQATEFSLKAFLLVFTNYCPYGHYVKEAHKEAYYIHRDLKAIFPQTTGEEKSRFDNFDYAYIGARYDKNYEISIEDLAYFGERVKRLHEIIEKECLKRIEEL